MLSILIYDKDKNLIKNLFEGELVAKDYFSSQKNYDKNFPGFWDGTNNDGIIVEAGTYIFQIKASGDGWDAARGGFITVE